MRSNRLSAAALLLAGCAPMPAVAPSAPAVRCARWRLAFDPRLTATRALTGAGQLVPSLSITARPVCTVTKPKDPTDGR